MKTLPIILAFFLISTSFVIGQEKIKMKQMETNPVVEREAVTYLITNYNATFMSQTVRPVDIYLFCENSPYRFCLSFSSLIVLITVLTSL